MAWHGRLMVWLIGIALCAAAIGPVLANPDRWKAEGWTKTDFDKSRIAFSDIMSGGPPKDGIPAIDMPIFRPVSDYTDVKPNEPVVGLEIAGDARAYPLRVLIWHEIANDVVGGTPVTVTYCPLCNSAIVFDRRLDSQVFDFGTTGKLRNSDLVMYDRQSESWWQQFTGEAIVGAMAGKELKMIPARLEAFGAFKARHPDGKVLVPNNPSLRDYGRNPYAGYDSAATPFLYRGAMPEGIEPMARVVVVRDGKAKPLIVAIAHLRKSGKLTFGAVEMTWASGQSSAIDAGTIANGRDVGTVQVLAKSADEPADGGAGSGERMLAYDVTFAFVAHAFHPDVAIIKE